MYYIIGPLALVSLRHWYWRGFGKSQLEKYRVGDADRLVNSVTVRLYVHTQLLGTEIWPIGN